MDSFEEPFYTTAEIAAMIKVHAETVRRIFSDEAGVIKLTSSGKNGKSHRVTLRIPRHVLQRVLRRMGAQTEARP